MGEAHPTARSVAGRALQPWVGVGYGMVTRRRYSRANIIRDVLIAVAGSALGYTFAYWFGIPLYSFTSVWLILAVLLLAETVYYVGWSTWSEARRVARSGILPPRDGSLDFEMRDPSRRRIRGWVPGEDLARSVLLLAIALVVLDLWFAFTRPDAWSDWTRVFVELPTVLVAIWLQVRRARYRAAIRRGQPRVRVPPRTGTG